MNSDIDHLVRMKVFEWLKNLQELHGDQIPRSLLEKGFIFGDRRVPIIGPQGIFKPAILPEIPISITTAPIIEGRRRPYEDALTEDGFLKYKYRGTNPGHHDNVGLRKAISTKTPLIYFHGIAPGVYAAAWPIFIVGDDPKGLTFTVAVDQPQTLYQEDEEGKVAISDEARRRYITVETQQRMHQQDFRYRVLKAYRERCAICRLHHSELLEAAHILPDTHPKGEPIIQNGISLCTIHHAAYDNRIIGIQPDYIVVVKKKVLEEKDGPMLLHGLQEFHQSKLTLPTHKSDWPKPEYLEERFQLFRAS